MGADAMLTQTRPKPRNRYRDCSSTQQILDEAECWLWELAELNQDIEDDPESWDFPDNTRDFILAALEEANEELARRERLRHRPEAPGWPSSPVDRRAELDEIKRRLPLADFLERMCLVKLQPQGKRLVTHCPLPGHKDDDPSFNVWPDQDRFHCFGCGRSGDVFTLAMHMLGEERFPSVVDVLAREAGIARPEGVRHGG